jgi:hypothetical protein
MRDDGFSGVPTTEVNEANDASVRNLPTLRNVDVGLLVTDLGKMYTFKLFVSNREGTVASPLITYLFATEPSTPSSAPVIKEYS